jgi:large subunit ribosomal protein L28
MAVCIVLGREKIRQVGNNRSHANNATKRAFEVNLQRKKYELSDGSIVSVPISAKGIRILDKKGIEFLESILKGEK